MPWVSVDVFLLICPSLLLHSSFSTCEDETSGNAGCTAVCYVLSYFTLQNVPKNRTFEVDRAEGAVMLYGFLNYRDVCL
jgi:hypothetical protein